jgi:serine/threonine-protein kinase RsbW
VVVEELVSNAARHGAAGEVISIELALDAEDGHVSLLLEDDGIAFDPTTDRAFAGPDGETGGGVGLALVKAWASGFRYSRRAGRNRVELELRAV